MSTKNLKRAHVQSQAGVLIGRNFESRAPATSSQRADWFRGHVISAERSLERTLSFKYKSEHITVHHSINVYWTYRIIKNSSCLDEGKEAKSRERLSPDHRELDCNFLSAVFTASSVKVNFVFSFFSQAWKCYVISLKMDIWHEVFR